MKENGNSTDIEIMKPNGTVLGLKSKKVQIEPKPYGPYHIGHVV